MAQASYGVTESGQPILILREGTSQSRGRTAQKNNINAVKLIAEVLKSSLGPRGMDKMLVDGMGDVTITNDGATIMKNIDVQHPAARMLVEVAKTIDSEVGDGTTCVVVFVGALMEKAESLLEKGVHPTVIVEGYAKAADRAIKILTDLAVTIHPGDRKWLVEVAKTSMAAKLVSGESSMLSETIVDALLQIAEKADGVYKVDLDDLKVEKKPGGSLGETSFIRGIIIDKEVVHSGMPKRVENARIALVNSALEIDKTEFEAKINISDPKQIGLFLDQENRMLKSMVEKIEESGANVLICQKGIDDIAQHYLARAGILAVRRVKESDVTKLARATGAKVITNLEDVSMGDLGKAALVEERKVEEDKWVFVEGCKNPKAVTILIRGGTQRIVDEAERATHDAIMVVKDVLLKPMVVAGGGAPEAEVAHQLRQWSHTLSGREQLAVERFADAIESIPLALAENGGLDLLDFQTDLRAGHSRGEKWLGADVLNGRLADMYEQSVFEPLAVKEQIVRAGTEVAIMILRVDDVIASSKKAPSAPPGGMGEME